jgi:hypothetical protein
VKRVGCVLLALAACRAIAPPETVRYSRITARGAVPECAFTVRPEESGWSLLSVTGKLAVEAHYDHSDRLVRASAGRGGDAARVEVTGDRLKVVRSNGEQEFDAPPGIIVTSAPDWADTFRICRLWKRSVRGRQEFPGLWIHPVQPAQRLTFTAERIGSDGNLDQLSIRLRGNSAYVAWVDEAGRMIKLTALPVKEGSTVLVLEE